MIAIFLILPYLLISAYLIFHVFKLTGAISAKLNSKIFKGIFLFFFTITATSPLTSFLVKANPLHFFLKKLNNIWLGFMLYAILILFIMDLVIFLLGISRKVCKKTLRSRRFVMISRGLAFLLACIITVYGVINAGFIRTTDADITIRKHCKDIDEMKIALVADLHLGYSVGSRQMKQMAEKINAMQPDLVLIAGDIYDNSFDAIENPEEIQSIFASLQSKYGVYACWGNHDLDRKFLQASPLTAMRKNCLTHGWKNCLKTPVYICLPMRPYSSTIPFILWDVMMQAGHERLKMSALQPIHCFRGLTIQNQSL